MSKRPKVLVCGGRDFDDYEAVRDTLNKLNPSSIVHGGARGADSLAERWCKETGCARQIFPAHWRKHGKVAGPLRNQQMIDEARPDLVVAFPGGPGTRHMMHVAKQAGVEVWQIVTESP